MRRSNCDGTRAIAESLRLDEDSKSVQKRRSIVWWGCNFGVATKHLVGPQPSEHFPPSDSSIWHSHSCVYSARPTRAYNAHSVQRAGKAQQSFAAPPQAASRVMAEGSAPCTPLRGAAAAHSSSSSPPSFLDARLRRFTRPGRPPPKGELSAKSMCFCRMWGGGTGRGSGASRRKVKRLPLKQRADSHVHRAGQADSACSTRAAAQSTASHSPGCRRAQ